MTLRRCLPWLASLALLASACGDESEKSEPTWSFSEPFDVEESGPENNSETSPNNITTVNNNAGNNTTPPVDEPCASDDDCPMGEACEPGDGGKFCELATGVADGEACDSDSDCQSGTCFQDWPGGYCTTFRCEDFSDCSRLGNDNKCLQNPQGPNLCVRICTTNDECREGYVCELFGNGEGLCAPGTPFDPAVFDNQALTLTCQDSGDQTRIDYAIADDTAHYMITPIHRDGGRLRPISATFPDGSSADFQRSESFLAAGSQLYGFMNPTLMPGTASRTAQVQAGDNFYDLRNEPGEMCHYILEEPTAGTRIDFNIYLVGVPGLSAATAPQDTDLQAVLAQFDAIYGPVGYTIGQVRYFDITGEDEESFRVLRSESDVSSLVALSERPGNTLDDALSMNVFFVQAFALGGAIGISLGLPGPAGLHGTTGSGVAFTSEFLGGQIRDSFTGQQVSGNDYTGIVFAHEVGHYLGLFHTSEQNGRSFDPLPDTPECSRISANCPDVNNLMFPFAGILHTEVSADQDFVVGANPLSKEASP